MIKRRLIFKGVSEIVGSNDLGLLILTDEERERQISIVCERNTAVQIDLRMKHLPVAEIMLPEALYSLLMKLEYTDFEIVIYDLVDGQYMTHLEERKSGLSVSVRVSDAVLFSIIGDFPIYIEESLMTRQSVFYNANAKGVSLPVNSISDDMLQFALDKAISEENYELASHLRDEKSKRNLNQKNKGISHT